MSRATLEPFAPAVNCGRVGVVASTVSVAVASVLRARRDGHRQRSRMSIDPRGPDPVTLRHAPRTPGPPAGGIIDRMLSFGRLTLIAFCLSAVACGRSNLF